MRLEGNSASLGEIGGRCNIKLVLERLPSGQGGESLRCKAVQPVTAPDTLELYLRPYLQLVYGFNHRTVSVPFR